MHAAESTDALGRDDEARLDGLDHLVVRLDAVVERPAHLHDRLGDESNAVKDGLGEIEDLLGVDLRLVLAQHHRHGPQQRQEIGGSDDQDSLLGGVAM